MRGSVRRVGDSYGYRVDLARDPVTGRRRQASRSGFGSRGECEAALGEVLAAAHPAVVVEASSRTLAQFVRDEWLPAVAPPVLLDSQPALDNISICNCAVGGIITVLNPGQTTTMIP